MALRRVPDLHHRRIGQRVTYRQAASVVGYWHASFANRYVWRALTVVLEHLPDHGLLALRRSEDGRVTNFDVLADLRAD